MAPENTLAAFARAFRDGADGIELDVRLSRDSVPVVIHDASVSHAKFRKRRVARSSLAKLKQIDVGSWFNSRHREFARLEYTRQNIPTLDEVFFLLRNQTDGNSTIFVELKCSRKKSRNDALARATLESIDRHLVKQQCVVISFNLRTVRRIKQLDGSIRTGALFGPRQRASKSERQIIAAAKACGADDILLHHRIATARIVAAAHENELRPSVWTVVAPAWLARAGNLNLHALITNCPANFRTF